MKKHVLLLVFSCFVFYLLSIPAFAEEQEPAVIPEESMQEMVSEEGDSSSGQEEVPGEEALVLEKEGEEGYGQQTISGDSPVAEFKEKQEEIDTAEAGTEKTDEEGAEDKDAAAGAQDTIPGDEDKAAPLAGEGVDGEETPVPGTDGADVPVVEEKKGEEVPASGEQEQEDPALGVLNNTEEVLEQREAPVRKASVRKMAAVPAASANTTESKGMSTAAGTTGTAASTTSTAVSTTGTKATVASTSTSTAAETQKAENQTATAESGEADKSTAVTAEGSGVPAGFTGVVKETEDGPWYYYRNGKRDTAYAGFAQDEKRNWYYVESGEVNRGYTGVAYREKNDTWYFFRNGELDWSYTGIAKDHPEDKSKTQWYRVEGGEVNLGFDGLAKRPENKTWYFLRDGILDWSYTGVGQNPKTDHWYRVKYGEVDFGFKGLAKRPEDKTWYFLKWGEVDRGYTGIGQNPTSKHWYRVKDGIVDFSFKGVAKRPENGIWYYLTRGELDWGYTGIAKDPEDQSWYRIEKGEVNWDYTGGALRPENNTWYYIKNGKLDWSYTGLDTDENNNTYGYRKGEKVFGNQEINGAAYYFDTVTGLLASAVKGLSEANWKVLTNIIGAVESGGQIYGNRDYSSYGGRYAHSPYEYTCTLGWAQCYGYEAKRLIQRIYDADPEGFKRIDSEGEIQDMLDEDWVDMRWDPSESEKETLIRLITSEVGKEQQDLQFRELCNASVEECIQNYSADPRSIIMFCEVRHQGGPGGANRIFSRIVNGVTDRVIKGDYSVDNIIAALDMDLDNGFNNQVGDYQRRHHVCAEFVKKYTVLT